jgi:hypothetical protein
MTTSVWQQPPKYDVQVFGACEVTLIGRANLEFWTGQLQATGLHPTEVDGQAELLITAVAARFMGIAFRELSVSLFVSRKSGGAARDGAYLIHAFNSLRFFAWVERTLFSTPYYAADVTVESAPAASFLVRRRGNLILHAAMEPRGAKLREPERLGEDGWAGPVFLPNGKLFHAKLAGATEVYPYCDPHCDDELTLVPTPDAAVVEQLQFSQFFGHEWHIRKNATHRKSKTMTWDLSASAQ